ncbi:MAG: exonuclease domain-containing protein [Nannocystaceae bacterium]
MEPREALPGFVAIDFETANRSPRSAVALAVVRVVGGEVAREFSALIKPPTRSFSMSGIHGIRPEDVSGASGFAEVWRGAQEVVRGARFFAAHHAAFDQGVMAACCGDVGTSAPRMRWLCTVALARAVWGVFPTTLPDVCRRLGIGLRRHHDALEDARACAGIVAAAWQTEVGRGWIRRVAG